MPPRSLEQSFARFRDARELDALAEVFDRTAPRLHEIARHLSRGRDEAQDLVQATFLAAIEHPERFDARRELLPWLLGILANHARRAAERRRAHGTADEALVDERAIDPAQRAADGELHAALEAALARVPATYRDVLREGLACGRAPEEIARTLGRSPGTVRVQLHRGLRLLRRLLPAGLALGATGLLAPRGLSAVRARVLRRARDVQPASTAVPVTLGGTLVSKKLALAGLVSVAAVGGVWLARMVPRTSPLELVSSAPAAAPVDSVAPASTTPVEPAREADVPPDPAETTAETHGALDVTLVWWDGAPAAHVPVRFLPLAERQPSQAIQMRTTDALGHAAAERIRAGTVGVEIERMPRETGTGWYAFEVAPGGARAERITLPRLTDVVGRVLDADGFPVAGAQLWVSEREHWEATAVERTQDDGSFRVRSVPEGFALQATARGRGSSAIVAWDELEIVEERTRTAELRLRGASRALAGTVTDPAGTPVAHARVAVRCFGANLTDGVHVRTTSAADGSFLFEGLHGQGAEVEAEAAGFALARATVALEEGRTAHVALALDTGFTVTGRLTLPDGRPAAHASIHATPDRTLAERFSLHTSSDEHGRFVLAHVPAGTVAVVASAEDESGHALRAQTRLVARAGDERTWDVRFGTGPAIRGRARDAAGTPLAGWSVQAEPLAPGASFSQVVPTDAAGAFTIPDLADAPYRVKLYAPEDARRSLARAVAGARPGGMEVELVLRTERTPSAHLLGRYLDPDGAPIRPEQLWASRADELPSCGNPTWSEDGRFRIGPMLAGTYELSASFDDGAPSVRHAFTIAEGEELDLGDLGVPPIGAARLVLSGPDGGPVPLPASLALTEGRYASPLASADGVVFESRPLRPGTYRLLALSGSAVPGERVEVEIRPGEITEVAARLVPGRGVRLDFAVPAGERLPARVEVQVRDAGGALLLAQEPRLQFLADHEYLLAVFALPLGTATWSAASPEGWSAGGALEVPPGADVLRVEVPLERR